MWTAAALGGIVMTSIGACATTETGRIHHSFAIEVGRGVTPIKKLRYMYGDLGWRENPSAAPGPLSALSGDMNVPEEFEISWESELGQRYAFKVPVRSKLSGSVEDKTVRFVIMGDRVEGYLGTREGIGSEKLERFY
jgi:hypothetical protein